MSLFHMRPGGARAVNRFFIGMAAAVVLASVTAVSARADDSVDRLVSANAGAVCASLDDNPTADGVQDVATWLITDRGLQPETAGQVLAWSVIRWCPRYLDEMQLFVGKWQHAGKKVA